MGRFVNLGQLVEVLGIGRTTLYNLRKAGKLPPPNENGKYDKDACLKQYLAIGEEEDTDFLKLRARREYYEAELKKLKYQERIGQLIKVEDLKKELFGTARVIRDNILNIPDRILPLLRAETNEGRQYEIFKKEIVQALTSLAELVRKYGAEADMP